MARYRATNWQQGILSGGWLRVIVDDRLQSYKLATRNTERKMVRSDHGWQVTGLQTGNKEF